MSLKTKNTDYRFSTASFSHLKLIVPGTPFPVTDGLLTGVAGVADLTMASGVVVLGVPLVAGYNPLRVVAVAAFTPTAVGAADVVFAGYCYGVPMSGLLP